MNASIYNIETLMLALHQKIEQYSDSLATSIEEGNPTLHVVYPPK